MNLDTYMEKGRWRLHHIAEKARVSIATVSRARLGYPVSSASARAISEATGGRVNAALLALGTKTRKG